MDRNRPFGRKLTQEHADVARTVAEEGIVLMKNDNNFFPIPKGRYQKIAIIGENAIKQLTLGGGSSELKPQKEISPLEGMIEKYGAENITYSMGYASGAPSYNDILPSGFDEDSLFRAAIQVAKTADIVLFFGGLNKNKEQDCEGGDRTSLDLPFGQNLLIEKLSKVNKNIGVILISGNAVSMPWINDIQGLIQSWYLGSQAGTATANIISGDVTPSGKLPFSYPKRLEDNAAHFYGEKSYPGDSINQYYMEDILVGYRWHDTKKIEPLFPFGHGLSYTTFSYGKITTDKKKYNTDEIIKLSFTLTNTGKVKGAESVQIYMSQKKPSVIRPVKELKSFKKVYLNPGETKTIELELNPKDFAFYDEASKQWIVETDDYILQSAASAADIKQKTLISITQ